MAATIARSGSRFRSAFLRLVFRALRLVPAPLYERSKRSPVARASFRRVLDATLPATGLAIVRVEAGPLRGMRLELQPRINKDMAVGRYEPSLAVAIEALLHKGDLCFDVGAHLGYMSLVMAKEVGSAGKVIAFEPDPELFESLRKNARMNAEKLAPVVPVPAAAGRASGLGSFRHGVSSGTGKLDAADGEVTVGVLALDDAAHTYGMPDLVKLDVEGAEVKALQGAEEILDRGRPAFLVEVHSATLERRCAEVLSGFDYSVEHLDPARAETGHLLARPAGRRL